MSNINKINNINDTKIEQANICYNIVTKGVLTRPFKKYNIIIDPAGSAFNGSKKYSGGGLSEQIYTFFGINGKTHNIKLEEGQSVINDTSLIEYGNNFYLIHTIGPDYKEKEINDNYWDTISSCISSIKQNVNEIIKKNNISINNICIRIPLISTGLYAPNDLDLIKYFYFYNIQLCNNDFLNKSNIGIRAQVGLFKPEEIDKFVEYFNINNDILNNINNINYKNIKVSKNC